MTAMRAALLQMTAGVDPAANAETLVAAVKDARAAGADMLFTPEMSGCLDRDRARSDGVIRPEDEDEVLAAVRAAAGAARLWVQLGSLAIADPDSGKRRNRSYLIDDSGEIRARYDKIHLFDVDLPTGESWRESNSYVGGDGPVLADTPWGALGLAICYDLRFAGLFNALSEAGATMVAIPAAFTVPTGEAHWHVLMRARAIENAMFVIAAAQVGTHEDGRATYGHSLVVDPWGQILLDAGDTPRSACRRPAAGADRRRASAHSRPAPSPADRESRCRRGRGRMISFDLKCAGGHVFEAWFKSSDAYADQRAGHLIACPVCGNGDIAKAAMAPAVAAKGNRAPTTPVPMAGHAPDDAQLKALVAAVARAQAQMLESSLWVGDDFAEQARAMHYGEAEHAPITAPPMPARRAR